MDYTSKEILSEKFVPSCPEAEGMILGGILRDGVGVVPLEMPVDPGLFFLREHRRIWAAIASLARRNLPHGPVPVMAELRNTGTSDVSLSLENMMRTAPEAHQMPHYLREAQEKQGLRRLLKTAKSIYERALEPGANPLELLAGLEECATALRVPLARGANLWDPNLDAITAGLDDLNQNRCLESGIDAWDQVTGGFGAGEMATRFGRPGSGKTAAAEQMALNIVERTGRAILVFSRDMGPRTFIERLACRAAGVPFTLYHRQLLSAEQKEALRQATEDLRHLPFIVEHPPRLTAEALRETVRRHAAGGKLALVILDHIQALDLPGNPEAMRVALTVASQQLRRSATDSGVPHLILAQANRDSERENMRPSLRHIKEFDAAAADSDTVCGIWKKTNAPSGAAANGLAKPIQVAFSFLKVRSGPVAEVNMMFDGTLMNFRRPTAGELTVGRDHASGE